MSKRRTIVPKGFEFYYDQFHFAPAVRDGKTLYCSGQVGWAGPGHKPPTDPKEQFKLAFENLRQVLEARVRASRRGRDRPSTSDGHITRSAR
jgi:enamine deaminase RidA (YjgF/YER057c/UK114 family)